MSVSIAGKRLRSLREATPMTEEELGERLGVDASLVGKWEHGEEPVPPEHLATLASMFGVQPHYLEGE
jgi:transcriptional regulator with XRE-family HTH domain